MGIEIAAALCLGVALSASCGFRVFVPLLIASLAAKFGGFHLAAGFEWLGSVTAVLCFSTAAVLEIAAYYVPVLDNFLDVITTPAAIAAGSLLTAACLIDIDPTFRWILAIIVGGGTAGMVQAGSALLRLGSTKFTAGTGNFIFATLENLFALIASILALFIPIAMAIIIFLLILLLVPRMIKRIVIGRKSTIQEQQ